MNKSCHSNLRRWTVLSTWSLALAVGLSACSDDEESKVGNTPPGANTGGTSNSSAGSTNGAGSPATGGSTTSTGGAATGTGGTTGTGNVGNIPSKACSGLPFTPSSNAGAGGNASAGAGGNASAGAGGEQACQGVSVEAEAVDVDMFMIMDRSMSMGYEVSPGLTRWDAMKTAIDQFAKSPQAAKLSVGIGFFNQSGAQDDSLDCDATKYATPKVGISLLNESGPQIIAAMNAIAPGGLTPTTPALRGALEHAKSWAQTHPNHTTVVALVTDGYPTQCSETAPSDVAEVAEQAFLGTPRIRTFVVGVGKIAKFNLDNYARSGGTREAYVTEDADMAATFVRALTNITDSKLDCEYEIPPPPSSDENIDFEKVSIIYTASTGLQEEVPKVNSISDCSSSVNGGWYFDDPAAPKKILVCPCTCANFGAGRVDVRLGCKPRLGIR